MRYHADYIVVVWTHAIAMYNVQNVPNEGLGCHMPKTMFSLGEAIEAPITFSSCNPRRFPSQKVDYTYPNHASSTQHTSSKLTQPPSHLTILARPRNPRSTLSQMVISPVAMSKPSSDAKTDASSASNTPPDTQFRLIRSSPNGISTSTSTPHKNIALCLGSSGRGIRIEEDGSLYRCVPRRVLSAYGVVDSTVDFHPNKKIGDVPVRKRYVLDGVSVSVESEVNRLVGFDDSLGRLVVCDGIFINVLDFY